MNRVLLLATRWFVSSFLFGRWSPISILARVNSRLIEHELAAIFGSAQPLEWADVFGTRPTEPCRSAA